MYILLTEQYTYFVEYLLNQLILSNSISEAMVFEDKETALKFRDMLFTCCNLKCSVNTYIKEVI